VAPDGDDGSPGTSGAPWRTLQHAANQAPSGATVIVRAGRYSGFTLTRSGTADDPTIFRAADGTRPIVDGALGGRVDTIKLSAVHDVRIVGLEITGSQGGNFSGAGLRTENGSTRIAIVDNVIHENHSYGIHVHRSTHVTIRDNDIHHNEQGVQISYEGGGTQILDNRIHHNVYMVRNTPGGNDDTGAVGIGFVRSTGHVLAAGNRVWGNRATSSDYTWDGSAFEIYGASNVEIVDNLAWDNENVLESGTDPGGNPPCANNVFARNVAYGATTAGRNWGMFLRCARDMVVAHNTFHDLDGFVFSIGADSGTYSGAIDGLVVVNNIASMNGTGAKIFGIMTTPPASVRIDYNLARTSGNYATLADGRVTTDPALFASWTGYQAHGVAAVPGFVDPSGHDYRLQADSPAGDAGVVVAGISAPWTGSAPDIGRHERP
jgi:parallel beta-helix repeat protein